MSSRGKYGLGRVYQPRYKDKNGEARVVNKWYIQFYDQMGRQRREPTNAQTEKEARKFLAARMGQAHTGTDTRGGERSLRYGDLRADLLQYFRINKMPSLEILSDGTESAKGLKKLDEFFGYKDEENQGMKIADFGKSAWEDGFIQARRREGVSDATIRNSAKLFERMLKLGVQNGRLTVGPKVSMPPEPEPRKEYLSKEQFDDLLGPKGMDERFHPVLKFLFYQGVRLKETYNTTWEQIDLSNGVFLPEAAKNKTGNSEAKPLQKEVVKALSGVEKAGEYVFDAVRSEGKNPAKMFEKAFRAAMLRLGFGKPTWQCAQCRATKNAPAPSSDEDVIACPNCKDVPMQYEYAGPTPHCLRASTVVYYREAGLSDPEIMAITGHKSARSFKGYSRTRVENIKERMDAAEKKRKKNAA